jgi:predicted TIM-barrel fold metal-dependent hydrolase
MTASSVKVDAYGHVSLPRFVTVEEYLREMDRNGIEKAILCTAETCPDIPEVSRAIVYHADRLRAVGVPLGHSFDEICESVQHQIDCGFIGFRIQARMIAQFPEVLDVFGKQDIIPWVVGEDGMLVAAGYLFDYLEKSDKRCVVAPHFGCMTDSKIFTTDGPLKLLFHHPRFLVVFSRQGAYEPNSIRQWALRLVQELGWQRILYGSEFPVCMWRNESYQDTLNWILTLGLSPTREDLDAFYGQNALRLLWDRQPGPAHLADPKWSAANWTAPGKGSCSQTLAWIFLRKSTIAC